MGFYFLKITFDSKMSTYLKDITTNPYIK